MRRLWIKCLALGLSFLPLSTYADAEMFRPFEPYIKAKFSSPDQTHWDCPKTSYDGANYRVRRESRSEYWKKQKYYNRHCGSAYVNCFYPDEDYPRYNGCGLDLRWYQRQPYYPPGR